MDQPISIEQHNIKMLEFRKSGIDSLFSMGTRESSLMSDRIASFVCVLEAPELKLSREFREQPHNRNFLKLAEEHCEYLRGRKAAALAALQEISADGAVDTRSRNLAQKALRRFSS